MNNIKIFLFLIPFSIQASVKLDLSTNSARFEIDEAGFPTSFLASGKKIELSYERGQSTDSWVWGASLGIEKLELDADESQNVDSDTATRNYFNLYALTAFTSGFFLEAGIDRISSPYFYIENFTVKESQQTRLDGYLKAGVFFKTLGSGGRIHYKYSLAPEVSLKGRSLSGSVHEYYFDLFFNQAQNYGVYFRYIAENLSGDYDSVYDSRSLGLIARY